MVKRTLAPVPVAENLDTTAVSLKKATLPSHWTQSVLATTAVGVLNGRDLVRDVTDTLVGSNTSDPALRRAQLALSPAANGTVYGRNDQRKVLLDAFGKADSHSLHLCGLPGTGKTVLVQETLSCKDVRDQICCEPLYVNIMNGGFDKINAWLPCDDCVEIHKWHVLVVDEVDQLKKKEEMRKLFEIPFKECFAKSRVLLITISNALTLNFDERLSVIPAIRKPLSIAFEPYTTDELQHIAMERFGRDILEPNALLLLCRRQQGSARDLLEDMSRLIARVAQDKKAGPAFPLGMQAVLSVTGSQPDPFAPLLPDQKRLLALVAHAIGQNKSKSLSLSVKECFERCNKGANDQKIPTYATMATFKNKLASPTLAQFLCLISSTKNPRVQLLKDWKFIWEALRDSVILSGLVADHLTGDSV
jgi:hypothetical protein